MNIVKTENITPKARPNIHEVVLKWFAQQKKGTVLDVPAGHGHLSMRLQQAGFDVTCGEIEPEIFKLKDVRCIYTDLNRRIDADDSSFDYICCIDGIEHMTDPYTAVSELARVLKPGGYGIFSIPNYSNIEKRLNFFLRGYLTKPKSLDDYINSGCNLFNFHNSPLTITLLDLIFRINGIEILCILKDRIKWKQYVMLPLAMVIKTMAKLSSKKKAKKHGSDITLNNDVLFGGNTLIFITRKTAPVATKPSS